MLLVVVERGPCRASVKSGRAVEAAVLLRAAWTFGVVVVDVALR